MILSKPDILKLINSPVPLVEDLTDLDTQVQVDSIDMCVDKIFKFKGSGKLGFHNSDRELPEVEEVRFSFWSEFMNAIKGSKPYYELKPGSYQIRLKEKVNLPRDVTADTKPRSSLMRCGATINSALWDTGYSGKGQVLLTVYNEEGLKLYPGARICQMVFHEASSETEGYNGTYQNEGVEKK